MDDFERELRNSFLHEADQLLAEAEQCFLGLEVDGADASTMERIFRLAHSLKGGAGAVGFTDVARFAHVLESLLLRVRNGEIRAESTLVSLLLRCNDALSTRIRGLRSGLDNSLEGSLLLVEMESLATSPKASVADFSAVDFFSLVPERETLQEQAGEASLRVSAQKLEQLLTSVGELVIHHSILKQSLEKTASPAALANVRELGKVTKAVQEVALGLRLVPLRSAFLRMRRVVRDLSSGLGKPIELAIEGAETEIDKTLFEGLGDPLVHIIRNAADHGIESPADRQAAGKPATGQILIQASRRGERVCIEISDDGRGMDPEMIRKKAAERGILPLNRTLTEREIYRLIFVSGFSTRDEVTEISGRGVGMDVVKSHVDALNGEIEIETQIGQGTTFRILLPLTLAIVDGIIVSLGGERYIVPLDNVQESVKASLSDIRAFQGIGEVLTLRGESLTLYRLSQVLGRRDVRSGGEGVALVVRRNERSFAVLVDDILGHQQVVIKRLGPELSRRKGYPGGAILGDGRAALILDLPDLIAGGKRSVAA